MTSKQKSDRIFSVRLTNSENRQLESMAAEKQIQPHELFKLWLRCGATHHDKLNDLFRVQTLLQKLLKVNIDSAEYKEKMTVALGSEVFEILNELPWKPWKKQQKFDKKRFSEEIIDAWHFLINLSLSAGMTADSLHAHFFKKHKINKLRQKNGY